MKNIHLVVLIIILSIVAVLSSPNNEAAYLVDTPVNIVTLDNTQAIDIKENEVKPIMVRLKNTKTDNISTVDLENYIIGVVAGEMPASYEIEALKAQAVAARTYAMYKVSSAKGSYDLVTDSSNQVYLTNAEMQTKWGSEYNKYYTKIKKCVEATASEVITYDDQIISAYYFSMSNGKTEDASLVFGEDKSYLVSVASPWDEGQKDFSVTKNYSKAEFLQRLGLSGQSIKITNVLKTDSGRVSNITINNETFTGKKIQAVFGLRSTDFTINVKDVVSITTKGYGHGVGMSQVGANGLAKTGKNYQEILKYYYQNVEITTINV